MYLRGREGEGPGDEGEGESEAERERVESLGIRVPPQERAPSLLMVPKLKGTFSAGEESAGACSWLQLGLDKVETKTGGWGPSACHLQKQTVPGMTEL